MTVSLIASRAKKALIVAFLSPLILLFYIFANPALAQDSTSVNTDFCREAIPSVTFRHLRTGRFSFFDAINNQIATRYSEFLFPYFGGYVIQDEMSPIVDQSKPMTWGSIAYSNGGRKFASCQSDVSIANISGGVDSFLGENENLLIGASFGANVNSLKANGHPIPQTTLTATTSTNSQSIIGGGYLVWMTKAMNFSVASSAHYNNITISPSETSKKTELNGLLGFNSQVGVSTGFNIANIDSKVGFFLTYENMNVDATTILTQDDTAINYGAADLSILVPGFRAQTGAYYTTQNPKEFFGWKSSLNVRRVYPVGSTSWSYVNSITAASGKVNLDSEWTEVAFDFDVNLRSIYASELFASIGTKFVWAEHPSQVLNGMDFSFKIGT